MKRQSQVRPLRLEELTDRSTPAMLAAIDPAVLEQLGAPGVVETSEAPEVVNDGEVVEIFAITDGELMPEIFWSAAGPMELEGEAIDPAVCYMTDFLPVMTDDTATLSLESGEIDPAVCFPVNFLGGAEIDPTAEEVPLPACEDYPLPLTLTEEGEPLFDPAVCFPGEGLSGDDVGITGEEPIVVICDMDGGDLHPVNDDSFVMYPFDPLPIEVGIGNDGEVTIDNGIDPVTGLPLQIEKEAGDEGVVVDFGSTPDGELDDDFVMYPFDPLPIENGIGDGGEVTIDGEVVVYDPATDYPSADGGFGQGGGEIVNDEPGMTEHEFSEPVADEAVGDMPEIFYSLVSVGADEELVTPEAVPAPVVIEIAPEAEAPIITIAAAIQATEVVPAIAPSTNSLVYFEPAETTLAVESTTTPTHHDADLAVNATVVSTDAPSGALVDDSRGDRVNHGQGADEEESEESIEETGLPTTDPIGTPSIV